MVLARVAFLIGAILRWFGLALLVPAGVAVFDANRTEAIAFVVSAAASTGVGLLLRRVGESPPDLRRPDALAVVAFTYLVLGLAGALPYLLRRPLAHRRALRIDVRADDHRRAPCSPTSRATAAASTPGAR